MAAPQFQAVGTEVAGAGALSVAWPTHLTNDIGVLLVESANQTVATPAGWTALNNTGTGTAGVTAATAIHAFWKRAASAAEANAAVADSGARQTAVIITFRGCIESGSPVDVSGVSVQATTSTSVTFPGVTTTVDEACVVNVMVNSLLVDDETVQQTTLLNASLSNLVSRLNTQEYYVPVSEPGSNILPIGMMSFGSGGTSGDVGEGPGLDTLAPYFTACMFVPNINTIGAQIDVADTKNILLVLNIAGNKSSYTTTIGGVVTLDMAKYTNNVRRFRPDADNTAFPDRLKFADAIRRRRIVCYVVDEPNLTNAENNNVPDITCAQTNQMALLFKSVWQGYQPLTLVRVPAGTMRDGWLGTNPSNTFWTGVDYCWSQYTLRHGRGGPQGDPWSAPEDPQDVIDAEKTIAATLNMGVVPSLNLWAGGIGVDGLGVSAAWDTNNSGGGTPGYVVGDRDTNQAAEITTLTTAVKSLASNPDWIRKHAEILSADPEIPFLLYWQHVKVGSPADEFINFYERADYQAAFDDAIDFGLARTTFSGWRTAK